MTPERAKEVLLKGGVIDFSAGSIGRQDFHIFLKWCTGHRWMGANDTGSYIDATQMYRTHGYRWADWMFKSGTNIPLDRIDELCGVISKLSLKQAGWAEVKALGVRMSEIALRNVCLQKETTDVKEVLAEFDPF